MPSNINSGLAMQSSRIALGLNCNRTIKSVASSTLFYVWCLIGLVYGVVKGVVVGGSKTTSSESVKRSLSVKLRRRYA